MKKHGYFMIVLILTGLVLFLNQPVRGGVTGKIKGVVKDAQTGDPLPGVNIVINKVWIRNAEMDFSGSLGAASNIHGEFIILKVPPGIYSVTGSMMGYTSVTQQRVNVNIDRTTTVDFILKETILDLGQAVIVEATRDLIQVDVSATENYVTAQEYQNTPFANRIEDVIGLQSGIGGNIIAGDIKIREGNAYEVGFMVDGMSMVDSKFNRPVMSVNPSIIQEIKIMRNGFNAEYGQSQSGVINVVTKTPEEKFHFSIDYQFEPAHRRHYGRSRYDPASRWEWRLYPDQFESDSLFLNEGKNGEKKYWIGWDQFAEDLLNDGDPNNDLTAEEANELWKWRHRPVEYGNKPGHNMDLSFSGAVPFIPWKTKFLTSFKYEYHPFTLPQARDHYDEKTSSVKLINEITPNMKLTLSGMYTDVKTITQWASTSQWSEEDILSYDGGGSDTYYRFSKPILDRYSAVAGIKFVHTISSKMFYELNLNHFSIDYRLGRGDSSRVEDGRYFHDRLYFDPHSGWIYRENGLDDAVSGHRMWGAPHTWDNSYSRRTSFTAMLNNQVNDVNEIKAGFEFDYELIDEDRVHWRNQDPSKIFFRKYRVFPFKIGAYIQDKIEFEGMIANLGVRFDYFDTNTDLYDVHRILEPDENGDPIWYDDNLFYAMNDGTFPTTRAKPKFYFSPRIGISHPLSAKSKIYFNYGHFVQTTRSKYLYEMALDGEVIKAQRLGDPTLDFEKTIAYELGYDQAIGENLQLHIGTFYKDYHDVGGLLAYVHADLSLVTDVATQRLHREIRGLEIEIRKSYGRWITGWFNYNIIRKSEGDLSVPGLNSDGPIVFFNKGIGIDGEFKGVPRQKVADVVPYARGVVTFKIPPEWGPSWKGISLLGNTSMTWQLFYQRGTRHQHPRQSFRKEHPDVWFHELSKYWANLRLSRLLNFKSLGIELYMDASNVVRSKFRYLPGGGNREDYFDDLYDSGRLDQLGTDKLTDNRILNTESDDVYWAQLREFIFGIRIYL
ncbi:TonB-dependent receptor [candidate division KSB1 bacterium]|nr:TonB-dependent receptor [candidate division KSB1 bacterium]MBL7092835.1 TonB-dependent receptor [candidate division KSB1 bacterium]